MPAIRSAASTSVLVDATAQRTLMAQYRADLANASINFNPTAQRYSRGSQRMIPYPSSEDVFLRSNHAVTQGTRGDLPGGQMLSFCWFCVKLAQPLPTRQMLGKF